MFTEAQVKAAHIHLKRMVQAQIDMWNASTSMEKVLKQSYTNMDELTKEACVAYDNAEQVTRADTEEFLRQLEPDGPLCLQAD